MVNLKKEDLKNDIYEEEHIRIEYSCSKNFKAYLEKVADLLSQLRLY